MSLETLQETIIQPLTLQASQISKKYNEFLKMLQAQLNLSHSPESHNNIQNEVVQCQKFKDTQEDLLESEVLTKKDQVYV